jgi:hypothetical protein
MKSMGFQPLREASRAIGTSASLELGVAAVAERLAGASAASAPVVLLAGFHSHEKWAFLDNPGF